jgi:uncharacterized repeat protein (TIGR04138 family)
MAWTVLESWGVRSTADVGTIVFQLVESGVLARQDSDAREDFDNLLDMQKLLEDEYFESGSDAADRA